MRSFVLCTAILLLSGCSVFGKSGVEVAPYRVLEANQEQKIELRHYDQLVLVSAPMQGGVDDRQNSAFGKLFDYISGNNTDRSEIKMTAPVFMDDARSAAQGRKIDMTAPVFMDDDVDQPYMSFVLPASFSLETAPMPKDPEVKLSVLKDYKVAVITFSGFLDQKNIQMHKDLLEKWIDDNGYSVIGAYKAAGYNPPFTIPALRRNEVLIPVNTDQ